MSRGLDWVGVVAVGEPGGLLIQGHVSRLRWRVRQSPGAGMVGRGLDTGARRELDSPL